MKRNLAKNKPSQKEIKVKLPKLETPSLIGLFQSVFDSRVNMKY